MNTTNLLKEEYGLTNIRLSRITHGLIDTNYKVSSNEGTYFFKEYRAISAADLEELHGELMNLKTTGIPVPVKVSGKRLVADSGRAHALYEFVDGDMYSSSIGQIESAACVFGKVLQAGIPKRSQLGTQPLIKGLSNAEQKLIALSKDETLPEEVKEICRHFCIRSRDVKDKLITCLPEKLDSLPLHPDFTERNMLFAGDSLVLLCDWQGYGPRILLDEVSGAFARFCTAIPFEGYLLENRVLSFKRTLLQNAELALSALSQYPHSFPWLLVQRQICNAPFRVQGLSGTDENRTLLLKALLWSNDFIEWISKNETELPGFVSD